MTQDEIIEMAFKAGVRDSLEYDHMECDAKSLEAFAKLVAEKRVEGMVVMTPDEFKSVWDKAQAEEREALCQAMEEQNTWDLYNPASTAIQIIKAKIRT